MNLVLIRCDRDLPTDGVRLVSSLLKRAGHTVRLIYLPDSHFRNHAEKSFEPLRQVLSNCDCVLFSVYSLRSHKSSLVSAFIRENFPSVRIIWGGPHCISAPELSLKHADAVCFGEADASVVEYLRQIQRGNETPTTGSVAYRHGGETVINEPESLNRDLDALPFLDFDLSTQYILEDDLVPMSNGIVARTCSGYPLGQPTLSFLTMRGCPHMCSYCNNCRFVAMYGSNSIRKQSVRRFMDEIEALVGQFGFFRGVFFGDDDFFMRSPSELEEFAARYKKNVRVPFTICVSANTFRQSKFEVLIDAGLARVIMGVQSVQPRTLKEVYNRHIDPLEVKTIAQGICNDHFKSHGVRTMIDFICDNPYETKEDVLANYRYMAALPRNTIMQVFKLSFFPGTPIYEKAVRDGHIRPFDDGGFRSYSDSAEYQVHYEELLLEFLGNMNRKIRIRIPRFFFAAISCAPLRHVMNRIPKRTMRTLIRLVPQVLARRTRDKVSKR